MGSPPSRPLVDPGLEFCHGECAPHSGLPAPGRFPQAFRGFLVYGSCFHGHLTFRGIIG